MAIDYLLPVFYRQREVVNTAKDILAKEDVEFDAVVGIGVSGIMIATLLSYEMEKEIIIVRKKNDTTTHSHYQIEGGENENIGRRKHFKWIFVDDLLATGDTARYTYDKIQASFFHSTCQGAYLYYDEEFHSKDRFELIACKTY